MTFDDLREFEPLFAFSLVTPDAMGDWGAWLGEYASSLEEALLEPEGDLTLLAELMAEDYLSECRKRGLYFPEDLVDSGDHRNAHAQYEEEVASEFQRFLAAWRASLQPFRKN